MNFYRRRPLALAISLCMTASAAAAFLSGTAILLLMAGVVLSVPVAAVILRRRRIRSVCNLASVPFTVLCGALTVTFLLTAYGYYEAYAGRYENAETGSIRAVVTEVRQQTSYNAIYRVRLESLDGEPSRASGLMSTEDALSLSAGDLVEAKVRFVLPEDFYPSYQMRRTELLSKGFVFTCMSTGEVKVVGSRMTPTVFFSDLRDMISAKMSLYLNGDSSALADALLLGDRDGLGRIRRDFTSAGVVHILALSGMHLAILSGGFERMLRALGIGSRLRSILVILLVSFYVALTGFLSSIVRAAAMMILVYVAQLLDGDGDRVTSLFISCGIIVLISPSAVFDVSLQLSFYATLGMTLFSEEIDHRRERRGIDGGVKHGILCLLEKFSVSFGAVLFVLPLQWFYFGEISPVCVFSTLIMSMICEGLLALIPVYLVCCLTGWHFMCGRLSFVIGLLAELCQRTAQAFAEISEPISLGYPFVPVLLMCLVSVIVLMMYKNCKSWLYAVVPAAVIVALFVGCAGIYENINRNEVCLDFVSYESHDAILLVSERNAMIVDITNGSRVPLAKLEDELRRRCITGVDALFLTDLSRRHVSSVRGYLKFTPVKRIYAPMPDDEYDRYIADDMNAMAEEYGAELIMYPRDEDVSVIFGDVTLTVPSARYIDRSVRPLEAVKFIKGEISVSYIGSSVWENGELWAFAEDAGCLIFGSNGPVFKSPPTGTVPEGVGAVHMPSREFAARLEGYTDGFSGVLSCGESYSVAFKRLIK